MSFVVSLYHMLSKNHLLGFLCFLFACNSPSTDHVDWSYYQGDPGANQYSTLDQIDRKNVNQLRRAWTYHSGDVDSSDRSQIQCNPLIINGVLYGTSPQLKLLALRADTGELIWSFDPFDGRYDLFGMGVNRGVMYWSNGVQSRILYSAGSILYSVDTKTGLLDHNFGRGGGVDLHDGLGPAAKDLFVVANSPGVVFEDLVIIGSRVSESVGAAPGHIRAFNVKDGRLVWVFHTIPKPGEFGYDTWPSSQIDSLGGANAWSGMSLDPARGMLFVPTGSASYDFYGGDRHGENLFANCILALDARTGKRIWHFQTVRHDLWDRDLPAPPNLTSLFIGNKKVDVVAQITKSGFVFVLDRDTGEPIHPIMEVKVRRSDLVGEQTWPTQPIPTKPPRFSRHAFTEDDITRRTPAAHAFVRSIWQSLRKGEDFIPPSTEGTILLPGFDGGGEWGGAAIDDDGIMYVNASEMPWIIKMIEYRAPDDGLLASIGQNIYGTHCQLCHGKDRRGASIYTVPDISNVAERRTTLELEEIIRNGQGMMPSFSDLSKSSIKAIIACLTGSQETASPQDLEEVDRWKHPYFMSGYVRFKDHEGYPAITPPWGTLNAIDLAKGELRWKITLGSHPGVDGDTGAENYGGPLVTAGDIVFIAATLDEKFRAFDRASGDLLWEVSLPAAGYATPSTYMIDGTQYVVIACGGGKLGTKSGDAYVAYSLPKE